MSSADSQPTLSFQQACQQVLSPFGAGQTWIVGVSGGVDSTVLLHTLAKLRDTFAINLIACYVDHQWRTPPAKELQPLWQQTQAWNIPLVIAPIPANTPKTETAARHARQQAFAAVVQQHQAKGVILAHHGDDQWETLLMRLFRGTGPAGLQGIQPVSSIQLGDAEELTILHPFLHFSKDDLLTTAEMFELQWVEDTTNDDTKYQRNALRKEVLPVIEKHFPQVRQQLGHLANKVTQQTQLANDSIEAVWQQVREGNSLNMPHLYQLDDAYQVGILSRLLQHHSLPASQATLTKLQQFLAGETDQFANANQCAIENAGADDHHWFFRIRNHRGAITHSGEVDTNVETDADTDPGITMGLPVKFRLAQLFPAWAGVGPASAALEEDEATSGITERLHDNANNTEDSSDSDTEEDSGAELAEALLTDSEDTDSLDENANASDDDELSEGETEVSSGTDEADNDSDDDDDDTTGIDAAITPRTTRIHVIDLPEYHAELEIARLGPDEVIPNPLPNPSSQTIYANLKPVVNDMLTIRYPRERDRIHPLGMMAGMTLGNFLVYRGLPKAQRNRVPLLCAPNGDVLWAIGCGLSELLRIQQRPTHRLTWRVVSPVTNNEPPPAEEQQPALLSVS